MSRFAKIDAVLKITERCNINCTYCYMFNKESRLYESKPKQMTLETGRAVAKFLARGAADVGASVIRIVFHGGEPTMMKPSEFGRLCDIFIEESAGTAEVQFTMQTNAMLIDEKWISLIEKYRIGVGVSLDGDRSANDRHRVDHVGKGTYDRSIGGVKKLFEANQAGRIVPPSALCVINPDQDGAAIFRHFVSDIGFIEYYLTA